jgi:hypothetical protein
MRDFQRKTDILIIGAGMTGLTAASELQDAGHDVLVMDKRRGVGGRMATRRIGTATFDHGAQLITARDPRFAAAVDHWLKEGVVEAWYRSSRSGSQGLPRWRGRPAMTAVAKHLARNLDLLLSKRLVSLRSDQAGWIARMDHGEALFAKAVLLTPPVPQSLALLKAGEIELSPAIKAHLKSIKYERCLAVLAVLEDPSRIPQPGRLALTEGPIAWIADNQMKGISTTPAITIHATAAFSLEHWESSRQESGRVLLQAAASWLGADVAKFEVHGWRYSKPVHIEAHRCLVINPSPPMVLAGDAFAGQRVEGAALSGWAAADALRAES